MGRPTVGRETPNCFTSCASLGKRPVLLYFPAMISVVSCREMVRCLSKGSMLNVVSCRFKADFTALLANVNFCLALQYGSVPNSSANHGHPQYALTPRTLGKG